jgi:hypothetical protein
MERLTFPTKSCIVRELGLSGTDALSDLSSFVRESAALGPQITVFPENLTLFPNSLPRSFTQSFMVQM